MKLDIIYEDEYMIACVKPYGMSTQSDNTGGYDLLTEVKMHIYDESDEDEEPYVAVINRLDKPVGGIVLFAKTYEVAVKLSDMIQAGEISKHYQAVVYGYFDEPEGSYTDYLVHDKKNNITRVAGKNEKGAKRAELKFEVLDEIDTDEGSISYVLIELLTGRHHQIRCQMAAHGNPIWGDLRYGKISGVGKGGSDSWGASGKKQRIGRGSKRDNKKDRPEIGLFSTRIEFIHPVTGEEIVLHREPEGKAFEIMDQMDW